MNEDWSILNILMGTLIALQMIMMIALPIVLAMCWPDD